MRWYGQFFIITAVLIAGVLLAITTFLASTHTVDYTTVIGSDAPSAVTNVAHAVQEEWWNTSWTHRQRIRVTEEAGALLSNESVTVTVTAARGNSSDTCSDLRLVQDGVPVPWENVTACDIDTYESNTSAVAQYRLDEGSGGATADATGTLPDADVGGTWAGGRFDMGVHLATDQAIEIPDDAVLDASGDPLTVSLWVRPADDRGQVLLKGENSDGNYGLTFQGDTLAFDVGSSTVSGNTALDTGRWYHVAGVHDPGGDTRLYVDGRIDGSGTAQIGNTNDNPLYVGDAGSGGTDMVVDDIRVYDAVLDAATVRGVARNGVGVNVSLDLAPYETVTVDAYYGNDDATAPGYSPSMQSTTLTDRPSTQRDRPRTEREAVLTAARHVDQFNTRSGSQIQLLFQQGCNRLEFTSPTVALDRRLC